MASIVNKSEKSERALVSWKEIAVFLNRAERTVKRWERERGLPVHRVPGGERGSVFAYPDELTEWLRGNSGELEAEELAADHGIPNQIANEYPNGQPKNGAAAKQRAVPLETAPPSVPAGHRWSVSPARVVAWLLPLAFTAAFIFYLWDSRAGSPVTAVGDHDRSTATAPDLASNSVAVLPFMNTGGDARSDYLSDGITESLIGNLSHIPQLKVRSRDSVFRLKGKDIEVQEAGYELGVSVVVSGRVTVQTNNIEVSTEITNVRDNTETWAKQYSGKTSDLIHLQEQIAGDIAEQLRSSLTSAEKEKVTRQGTQNVEAYESYLKGRYAWNLRDHANLEAAISYFNDAIAKDPDYALAYSGLADVYSTLPFFGADPAEDFPRSSNAARKALELDPTLAHPHAILGSIEMEFDWDFAGGEDEFRKAIALDPYDATAHQWFAENLGMLGGSEQEALKEVDQAHLLDPTSLIIRRVKGSVLVAARRYDDAIAVCRELLDENPTFNLAHDCLGYAYWGKRMYPQFVEQWTTYLQHDGDTDDARLGDVLERGFRSADWRGALTEGIKEQLIQRQTSYASPYKIARLYAALGDKEKAFEWLDTAYREHDFLLKELNTAFELDDLRSDPRFAELVRKVGLPNLH